MKSLSFSTSLVLFVLAVAHAHEDSSKPLSNIRTVEADDSKHDRQLSMWGSFLSFVKCPPGPLGFGCSGNSGGSSSGGGSSGGTSSSGASTDGTSSNGSSSSTGSGSTASESSSGSSTSGEESDANYTDDGGSESNVSGTNDSNGKSYNTYSENYGGEESGTGGTAAAIGVRNTGYTWAMVLGGMALLATGVAAVAHATSKNHETVSAAGSEGAHKLKGSVKKRNVAFKDAMKLKLGWRKEVSDLEESLA
jgi:hypothetical protein